MRKGFCLLCCKLVCTEVLSEELSDGVSVESLLTGINASRRIVVDSDGTKRSFGDYDNPHIYCNDCWFDGQSENRTGMPLSIQYP